MFIFVCLWWELSVSVVNLVTMVYAELSDFTHTWKSVLFYHHLYFPHPPNLETIFLRVWLFAFFFFLRFHIRYMQCLSGLFHLACLQGLSMLLQMAEFLLSSWLNNTPSYKYMRISLLYPFRANGFSQVNFAFCSPDTCDVLPTSGHLPF